jgi:protein-S-isoprenylcysteine O-methyltransferase Ste14
MLRYLIYGDIVFFVGVYIYCLLYPRPGWQYVAGMVIATAGYTLWLTARAQLGKSFSPRPEARELITSGLYSKFRNPIYFFSSIGIVAMCLGMRWYPAALAYATLASAMQWVRSRAEAKVLEARFGDEYRKYRSQTWF